MEYSYKVYFNNKSFKLIKPKVLEGKSLDKYDSFYLDGNLDRVLEENGIDRNQINRINILCKGKDFELEYSTIDNNPYFDDILSYVKDKQYNGRTIRVIDTNYSKSYKEMADFLFGYLEYAPDLFMNNIYHEYRNKFSSVLNSYIDASKSPVENVDINNIESLKRQISTLLSSYEIYRTIARARYEYDKRIQLEEKAMLKQLPPREELSLESNYEQLVSDYNRKYDEFIEENEYSMMTGDDSEVRVR